MMRPMSQAFIDSMKMYHNTPTYKELIQSVRYVRPIVSLTRTQIIVISQYMKRNRFPQKPQVRRLVGIMRPISF